MSNPKDPKAIKKRIVPGPHGWQIHLSLQENGTLTIVAIHPKRHKQVLGEVIMAPSQFQKGVDDMKAKLRAMAADEKRALKFLEGLK